jgi:transketolase
VYRPADNLETAVGWTLAIQRRSGPTALILTRQKVPSLEKPASFKPRDVLAGAYVVVEETSASKEVVVATGSEVAPAATAARELGIRAVSMPSVDLFFQQPEDVRTQIVPKDARVAVVEASYDPGWYRLAGSDGLVIGIEGFGSSAPAGVLAEKYGFTQEAILSRLKDWLGRS